MQDVKEEDKTSDYIVKAMKKVSTFNKEQKRKNPWLKDFTKIEGKLFWS